MQPKLKSKVQCLDGECGEVTRVIVDPLSREISHIVVGGNGTGALERQVPITHVQAVTDGEYRRAFWHYDFLAGLDGVDMVEIDSAVQFSGARQLRPAATEA